MDIYSGVLTIKWTEVVFDIIFSDAGAETVVRMSAFYEKINVGFAFSVFGNHEIDIHTVRYFINGGV